MRPGNDVSVYYNENNPFAAAWLRELVKAGAIAPGDVDDRSIEDVTAADLLGYTQCHFFAGIGVWSHALRRAGWPDSRPVWTGSCPCQPFSAAGKRKGTADERHLWPAVFHLIRQCRPVTVFGEQVASCDGLAWLDLVSSDLEGAGYACGAVDTCAAGFGAPHVRQRLYWVAHATSSGDRSFNGQSEEGFRPQEQAGGYSFYSGLADAGGKGLQERKRDRRVQQEEMGAYEGEAFISPGNACGLENTYRERCEGERLRECQRKDNLETARGSKTISYRKTGPVNGFWRDADWLLCRDGKWRPVEPGTFPLAYGATARMGRLRGYGNALVAPQATAFIKAFMDIL